MIHRSGDAASADHALDLFPIRGRNSTTYGRPAPAGIARRTGPVAGRRRPRSAGAARPVAAGRGSLTPCCRPCRSLAGAD